MTSSSTTIHLKTGCGTMHLTHLHEANQVLCHHGRSGSCGAAQSDALARLASLALSYGAQVREITRALRGIECPNPMWGDGIQCKSCADAFAQALAISVMEEAADVAAA